jgi:hypothetical protein
MSTTNRRKNAPNAKPQRPTLSVESLEDRVVPAGPEFAWQMDDRLTINSSGLITIRNDPAWIQANTYGVTIDLSQTQLDNGIDPDQFELSIATSNEIFTPTRVGQTETYRATLPAGTASVSVRASLGTYADAPADLSQTFTQMITLRDYLVVAVGDSFSSGEGNPEVPQQQETTVTVQSDLLGTAHTLTVGSVQVSVPAVGGDVDQAAENLFQALRAQAQIEFGKSANTPFAGLTFHEGAFTNSLVISGLPVTVEGGSSLEVDVGAIQPAEWANSGDESPEGIEQERQNRVSHRSTYAAPAQMALELEQNDPHSSVTFVFVSASGSELNEGVLGAYAGVKSESGYDPDAKVGPQIDQIDELIGDRVIDAMAVSIGGNDIGFANVITSLLLIDRDDISAEKYTTTLRALKTAVDEGDPSNWQAFTDTLYTLPPEILTEVLTNNLFDVTTVGLNHLADAYAKLNEELQSLGSRAPRQVYLTEYPDPFTVMSGDEIVTSDQILDDVRLPGYLSALGVVPDHPEVSREEIEWVSKNVVDRLNKEVKAAATTNGWTYIDGIRAAFRGHGYDGTAPFAGDWNAENVATPWVPVDPASARWFVTSTDSVRWQGPPDATSDASSSTGTVHPNRLGQAAIARLMYEQVSADLLPTLGKTGDVVLVDAKASGGTSFELLTTALPYVTIVTSDQLGEGAFKDTGRFYIVPNPTGPLSLPFEGVITVRMRIDGIREQAFEIEITKGVSYIGSNAVTFGSSPLDILRLQQRLRHLGYPGANGQPLQLTAQFDANTKWAIGLFNAAVTGSSHSPNETNIRRDFINSPDAPRWIELQPDGPDGPGGQPGHNQLQDGFYIYPNTDGTAQSDRWATDLVEKLVQSVQIGTLQDDGKESDLGSIGIQERLELRKASPQQGGDVAGDAELGADHQAGLTLDIETSALNSPDDPFYATVLVNGVRYVAGPGAGMIIFYNSSTKTHEARTVNPPGLTHYYSLKFLAAPGGGSHHPNPPSSSGP